MAAGCEGHTKTLVADMFFLPSLGLTMRAAVREVRKRMVVRGGLRSMVIGFES